MCVYRHCIDMHTIVDVPAIKAGPMVSGSDQVKKSSGSTDRTVWDRTLREQDGHQPLLPSVELSKDTLRPQ
jgi:hypothetical protein